MKSLQLLHQHHDLELDLGLSIGGSFRNLPAKSTGLGSLLVSDGDDSGVTDEKNRCEIRRREVKRKRDEKKRQNRGGRSFVSVQDDDDEDDERNRPLKREKKLEECDLMNNNVDLNKPPDSAVVQMPYSYPSLQYVPFLNGYAFPCVMPYWASGAAAAVVDGGGDERTLHQPVACRSFKPFEANRSVSDVGFSNLKTGSCGSSPVCSSSVISDNYPSSSSHEGGGNSYTRSNSCNSSSDRRQIPNPNPKSNDSVNDHPCSDIRAQCEEKFVKPHVCKTNTTIKKEPIIASNKDEVVVPMPTTSKSVLNPPLKSSMTNVKMEIGKPPKPQNQSHNVPNLQQMPCVSTTGVGPNGKTITGFLYRYSNSEVSILCVCHGESFSPAEFVKHAGGGEVSHPLRHITVLPSTIR